MKYQFNLKEIKNCLNDCPFCRTQPYSATHCILGGWDSENVKNVRIPVKILLEGHEEAATCDFYSVLSTIKHPNCPLKSVEELTVQGKKRK